MAQWKYERCEENKEVKKGKEKERTWINENMKDMN